MIIESNSYGQNDSELSLKIFKDLVKIFYIESIYNK